ncbi:hypothetical protein [Pseudophaeobacter flagellatus]|uniref:hypothetical protein n=1 Tax=Pseudophaeobacter flagellatus TaxID=2899119 RepID=UPI001E5EB61E|nr:hypothetical protein [Pseudophaeobacter flagellatus]MCD9149941.1 hypothetical protein [Pseudophaeobacter flagellatus]
MSIKKSLGILVFCTQAVVVVDYNMQSQAAGLAPGELSMKDYAAIVQKRYDKVPAQAVAGGAGRPAISHDADRAPGDAQLAELAADRQETSAQADAPAAVCIRRGTTVSCQ